MSLLRPGVLPPWAESGDRVQPTISQLQEGWPNSDTAPARQRWNWILNYLANGVRYLSRRGLPDYAADETYSAGDYCTGPDNKSYRSLVDNNINFTPASNPTKWARWGHTPGELITEVDAIIGLNFKNLAGFGLEATDVLEVANAGHWHSVNVPTVVLVLPTLASMVAAGKLGSGFPIRFQFDTLVQVDPDATATDFILPSLGAAALNEYTFKAGEFAYIACNGTSPSGGGWYVLFAGMGSDRERKGSFTTHATPGSVKNIAFDREFPNACDHITFTPIYNNAAGARVWLDATPAANSINVRSDVANMTVLYHAYGR